MNLYTKTGKKNVDPAVTKQKPKKVNKQPLQKCEGFFYLSAKDLTMNLYSKTVKKRFIIVT